MCCCVGRPISKMLHKWGIYLVFEELGKLHISGILK